MRRSLLLASALASGLLSGGCFHTIHVSPEPAAAVGDPIPVSVGVEVTELSQEGPGSIPRIYYLKWTKQDLQQAVERYLEKRRTFAGVTAGASDADAGLRLTLRASLLMEHRDRYIFILRIEGTLLKPGRQDVKTYTGRGRAVGPWARWTTESDERPITEAVRLALDELFANIEADRAVILKAGSR